MVSLAALHDVSHGLTSLMQGTLQLVSSLMAAVAEVQRHRRVSPEHAAYNCS